MRSWIKPHVNPIRKRIAEGVERGVCLLGIYNVSDTKLMDAFDLPSFFDPRAALYKEWHDFVFYDRGNRVFGLLNFAVYGNPYDSQHGYGSALVFLVDPSGKAHTAMKLIPINKLGISSFSPDFISEDLVVRYQEDDSFRITGEVDGISLDLVLRVMLPPVSTSEIALEIIRKHEVTVGMLRALGEMAKLWDRWVELPRLSVNGEIGVESTVHTISSRTGYQDHEGGRFDWGNIWGWDTGVLLCDSSSIREPDKVSFLFYRDGPEDANGGIIVQSKNGEQTYFDGSHIRITRSGSFSGETKFIPGITRLIYPDYRPSVAERITFSAAEASNKLEITVKPKAVCSIVVPSAKGRSETIFNEMFCDAYLRGNIEGENYKTYIPCWFESVRPRKGIVGQCL